MYSYEDSVYLKTSFGSKWEKDSETQLHLENKMVKDLFVEFQNVYLVLSHPDNQNNIFADLKQFRLEYGVSSLTLAEMLVDLANRAIEPVSELPSTSIKTARYLNAVQGSYKIDKCVVGMSSPANFPVSEMKDLMITRPEMETDLSLLHTHCLMSVNGFYHRTDYGNEIAYIYDGAKTLQKTHENHVGIFNFLDIGEVKQEVISIDRIFSPVEGDPLKTRVGIRVNQDLTNKSIILVLGGYLVLPEDGVFWQTGDQILNLDLNRINYIERLFESNGFIDLSSMNMPHPNSQMGDDVVLIDELWSDAMIIKYLTLSQSFLVVVDVPHLDVDRTFVRSSGVAGMLVTYQKPEYPLIMGLGRQVEYWRRQERPHWSVVVKDPLYRNYILSLKNTDSAEVLNNHLQNVEPFQFGRGFFLKLSAQPSA